MQHRSLWPAGFRAALFRRFDRQPFTFRAVAFQTLATTVQTTLAALLGAVRWGALGLLMAIALGLGGCVDTDLQIHYTSANRGEIVQQIHLGEKLKQLNATEVSAWLKAIERCAVKLGGHTTPTADTLAIAIPFYNGTDLATKFNQLLDTVLTADAPPPQPSLPKLPSHLTITSNNFLVVERHHLHYEIDLRSLGVASATGDLLVSPTGLFDLAFTLKTPWGAREQPIEAQFQPPTVGDRHQQTWQLVPGELNTIDTIFWLPNGLGIGTVLIGLFVLVGIGIKSLSQLAPRPQPHASFDSE